MARGFKNYFLSDPYIVSKRMDQTVLSS